MTTAFKPDLDRLRLMVYDDNPALSIAEIEATTQRILSRPGLPAPCVHRMPQGATAFYAGVCQRCGRLKAHTPLLTFAPDPPAVPSRKFMVAMDWDTLTGIFPDQLKEFFKMDGGDVIMVKPAQAELIATAPQGAVHLRLKEYK